jgi:hypothetical protein
MLARGSSVGADRRHPPFRDRRSLRRSRSRRSSTKFERASSPYGYTRRGCVFAFDVSARLTLPPPLECANVIGAVSPVSPERSHGDEVPGGCQAAKLTERDPQLPGRLGRP